MRPHFGRMATLLGILFAVPVVVSACVVGRGTVLTKISERQAKVRLADNEVAVGDRVVLFRWDCESAKETAYDDDQYFSSCQPGKEIARGEVIQTLNEHDSVIEMAPGVEFEEGLFVEKQQIAEP